MECSHSTHMAQLAAVLANPSAVWPALPRDPQSLGAMGRGLNLFSPEGRQSSVKAFFDLLDMQARQMHRPV